MKVEQISFSAGEISPLLHARVDLARYRTGLSELVNMIVLPQGGVARRAGFQKAGTTQVIGTMRLIPFEYNTTDSVMLEFGGNTGHLLRVWRKTSSGYEAVATLNTPYSSGDLKDLRYVQSGNVMFLVHRNYAPRMLKRNSMTSWSLEELPYRGGPWIEGEEWCSGAKLRVSGIGNTKTIYSLSGNVFSAGLIGTLLQIEYAVEAKTEELFSVEGPNKRVSSQVFEVKGTMNVQTFGEWRGLVSIDRSVDGGNTWVTIRQYKRLDTEKQGQWDFTISETEDYIVYRVTAWHYPLRTAEEKEPMFRAELDMKVDTQTNKALPVKTSLHTVVMTSGSVSSRVTGSIVDKNTVAVSGDVGGSISTTTTLSPIEIYSNYGFEQDDTGKMDTTLTIAPKSQKSDEAATILISVSGFLKKEIYKINSVKSVNECTAILQSDLDYALSDTTNENIRLWNIGAWGDVQGYPSACTMYQDRLIFAGSNYQPQTIWMSRTGDYADFSTSDPLRDDDAVNITLAGSDSDRIHSFISSSDLLVFTTGGEWRIKGSGDSGAITPTSLTSHQQTNIGTKNIQPLIAGGHIIFVQSQGKKVYALGYDLNIDGYTGSDLTIMSSHIFEGKEIIDMAYQKEPDSLLWFVLNDGTCAVCTYNPEHEVIGWSRQEIGEKVLSLACMHGTDKTEMLANIQLSASTHALCYIKARTQEAGYTDDGKTYESRMRTLRLNVSGEDGSAYTSEKLIARLIVSALRTTKAWAAPGNYSDEAHNWERRRRLEMEYKEYLQDVDIQLDNGFSTDAAVQIRSWDNEPLMIAGITPIVTVGG